MIKLKKLIKLIKKANWIITKQVILVDIKLVYQFLISSKIEDTHIKCESFVSSTRSIGKWQLKLCLLVLYFTIFVPTTKFFIIYKLGLFIFFYFEHTNNRPFYGCMNTIFLQINISLIILRKSNFMGTKKHINVILKKNEVFGS